MAWTIGVDVGGTFTDFFAYNETTGEKHVAKSSSTPANPADAVVSGLKDLMRRLKIDPNELTRVSHGTTVGTNALIQRRGGRVAMVTTAGFRDLLEIGRQTRPHMFDLLMDNPPPVVPRERRLEVGERLDAEGEVLRAIDQEEVKRIATELKAQHIESCAVCFLFAFRNPTHEQLVANILRDEGLNVPMSLSSEVQPEFREYERFSTTVLNAYLQPVMHSYISTLESEVNALAPNASLGINQSSGGLMSAEHTRTFPVRTALSGPAAGAIGAINSALQTQVPNVITLDMGGTSADVALIRDYRADVSFDRDVAGFPIRLPAIDIETVGAGGGSVAWFDLDGLMKVGPTSAGAFPGPACYGNGGEQPTVTDANLILGRLSSKGLLGGEMGLDPSAASAAYQPLAERLGFSLTKTAHGVLGIVVANMVRTIRTISVERGHDPRKFALMAFGGAGPLHARDVAASLGISEIIIPSAPGIVCAEGLLVSDLKEDFVRTERVALVEENETRIANHLQILSKHAEQWFDREAVSPDQQRVEVSLDARYVGQNFELPVSIEPNTAPASHEIMTAFLQAHEQAYGYASDSDPIELINFRLVARGKLFSPSSIGQVIETRDDAVAVGSREVFFDADNVCISPVYARSDLKPGHRLAGPAVIDQLDTTTLVYPQDVARVTHGGNLCISLASQEPER